MCPAVPCASLEEWFYGRGVHASALIHPRGGDEQANDGEGAGGLAVATVRGLADDALLPGCAPARAALEGRCSVAGAKSRDAVGRPARMKAVGVRCPAKRQGHEKATGDNASRLPSRVAFARRSSLRYLRDGVPLGFRGASLSQSQIELSAPPIPAPGPLGKIPAISDKFQLAAGLLSALVTLL